MSLCKFCKKRIKWVTVVDDTAAAKGQPPVRWIPLDSKTRVKHECLKKANPHIPSKPIEDPWWNK